MGPSAQPAAGGPSGGKKRKDPPQQAISSKRPGTSNGDPSGRDQKRVKFRDARSLASQPADAALNADGELDLQAFLNARQYEIKALEDGMRRSKAVNNRRAFQLVPRSMRRRTASHNLRRLPKRLRARARHEQLTDNTPTVESRRRKPRTTRARIRAETAKKLGILAKKKRARKLREAAARAKDGGAAEETPAAMKQLIETRPARPKIRRNVLNDPPKPKARSRKRQIDKTWLPTHMWHTKRARMTPPKEPLWRFAVPLTPNEKCYRPTHRASGARGAVVWDMSYMSTIGLYGAGQGIERTLKMLGLTHPSLWDERGQKWRDGRRKWSGVLSKEKEGHRRDIGPATVIWNPETPDEATQDKPSESTKKDQRQVLIRLHPSCFLEVFNILTKLIKRETPRLYVEDLRFEIGSIELTGPCSTEVLLAILRPYRKKGDPKEAHAIRHDALTTIYNASTSLSDVLLAFSVQDPRLHYPPRTVKLQDDASNGSTAFVPRESATDEKPAPFLICDRNARFKASCLPSQKALNRRKGAGLPGTPLDVTVADSPIPVILFASRGPTRQAQGTWTLLAPWKCILPIWYSLVHYPLSTGGNPRFGGLQELRQVSFEQGVPWFPGDYPGTDAGAEWELEQRAKRKAEWERRPKSKRVAWESLDLGVGRTGEIGIGWACEFERLFGLQTDEEKPSDKPDGARDSPKEPEPEPDPDKMDVDGGAAIVAPDEHSQEPADEKRDEGARKKDDSSSKKSSPHPLTLLHHLSKPSFNALSSPKHADPLPPNSIITVKVTFLGRGVPEPCARIYRLPPPPAPTPASSVADKPPPTQVEVPSTNPPPRPRALPSDLRDQWLSQIPARRQGTVTGRKDNKQNPRPQPRRLPAGADFEARKSLLAQSLTAGGGVDPAGDAGGDALDGGHPLVPDEGDLIGYVTKGEFSLSEGKGVAIGCVSAEKAVEALREGEREGRLCVVRNAGERHGWVARWEVI